MYRSRSSSVSGTRRGTRLGFPSASIATKTTCAVFAVMAIFPGLVAPYEEAQYRYVEGVRGNPDGDPADDLVCSAEVECVDIPRRLSPDDGFPMGTTAARFDVFSRVVHGSRISLQVGFLTVGFAILIFAIALETYSFRTAIKEVNHVRPKDKSWWWFIRNAKSPELPVALVALQPLEHRQAVVAKLRADRVGQVDVVEPDLAVLHAREAVTQVDVAFPDRLHLRAAQHDAGLDRVEDVVVATGLAVAGHHPVGRGCLTFSGRTPADPPLPVGFQDQLFADLLATNPTRAQPQPDKAAVARAHVDLCAGLLWAGDVAGGSAAQRYAALNSVQIRSRIFVPSGVTVFGSSFAIRRSPTRAWRHWRAPRPATSRASGATSWTSPTLPIAPPHPERTVHAFDAQLDTDEGWAKYNRHYWLEGDFDDFVRLGEDAKEIIEDYVSGELDMVMMAYTEFLSPLGNWVRWNLGVFVSSAVARTASFAPSTWRTPPKFDCTSTPTVVFSGTGGGATAVATVGPAPGDTITYVLTATNTGNATASDVVIYDQIPNYTNYVSGGTFLLDTVYSSPASIAPGGTAQILANWVHVDGEPFATLLTFVSPRR